jgi:hypothetical protein
MNVGISCVQSFPVFIKKEIDSEIQWAIDWIDDQLTNDF